MLTLEPLTQLPTIMLHQNDTLGECYLVYQLDLTAFMKEEESINREAEHDAKEHLNNLKTSELRLICKEKLDEELVRSQFKLDDNVFLKDKPNINKELVNMLRNHGEALTGVGGSFKPG